MRDLIAFLESVHKGLGEAIQSLKTRHGFVDKDVAGYNNKVGPTVIHDITPQSGDKTAEELIEELEGPHDDNEE